MRLQAPCEDCRFSVFPSGECEGVQDIRWMSVLHRPERSEDSECEQDPERLRPAQERLENQNRNNSARNA